MLCPPNKAHERICPREKMLEKTCPSNCPHLVIEEKVIQEPKETSAYKVVYSDEVYDLLKFKKEVEYDEGGIHYICFDEGEYGLFRDGREDNTELLELLGKPVEFTMFVAWEVPYDKIQRVLEILKKKE
jgi:hypothetical protein